MQGHLKNHINAYLSAVCSFYECTIPVPNMPMIININSNHPGNFDKTFQTSELELQSLVKLNEYHIG